MNILVSTKNLLYTAAAIFLAVALVFSSFALFEPLAVGAQSEAVDITIQQVITAETSFTADPANVVMDSTIGSISGGSSLGTTTFTVQSNDPAGYNVTLAFSNDPAMQHDAGGSNVPDYIEDSPGTPDWDFGEETSGGSAQFGFGVIGASAGIVAANFQDNGSDTCGGGLGSNTYPTATAGCWSSPSTTALTILNSASPTAGAGDESSVHFQVHVPANASPAVDAGTTTATATLTVTAN